MDPRSAGIRGRVKNTTHRMKGSAAATPLQNKCRPARVCLGGTGRPPPPEEAPGGRPPSHSPGAESRVRSGAQQPCAPGTAPGARGRAPQRAPAGGGARGAGRSRARAARRTPLPPSARGPSARPRAVPLAGPRPSTRGTCRRARLRRGAGRARRRRGAMSRLPGRTAALLLALLAEVGAAPGRGARRGRRADNAGAEGARRGDAGERPRGRAAGAAASGPADDAALGRAGTRCQAPPRPPSPLRVPPCCSPPRSAPGTAAFSGSQRASGGLGVTFSRSAPPVPAPRGGRGPRGGEAGCGGPGSGAGAERGARGGGGRSGRGAGRARGWSGEASLRGARGHLPAREGEGPGLRTRAELGGWARPKRSARGATPGDRGPRGPRLPRAKSHAPMKRVARAGGSARGPGEFPVTVRAARPGPRAAPSFRREFALS